MSYRAPAWVTTSIRNYDHALRLRWSLLAKVFVLDRKISNAAPGSHDSLKEILAKRVGRLQEHEGSLASALRNDPVTLVERSVIQTTLQGVIRGRLDAGVRLESLKAGYVFVYWVGGPTADQPWSHLLECILYTLRANDIWSAGGTDAVYAQMMEDDRIEEVKRQAAITADLRSGAGEVYDDIQRKIGERVLVGKNLGPKQPVIQLAGA